jgi:phage-related protein
MKNFYIDNLLLHSNVADTGYVIKQTIQGLEMPPIRLASYDKIGEWGAFISNQLYGGRLITLEGYVYSPDITTYNVNRRALQSILQINKDSNSIPLSHLLKFTTMDNLSLQVECYLKNLTMEMTGLNNADFAIDLYAPDFGLEQQTATIQTMSTSQGGGVIIPVILPAIFAPATGGSIVATNNGDVPAYPIITLNGPLTNPILQSDTLLRFLDLNYSITTGQTIVIDMKNRTIMAGNTPILSALVAGSNWFWLNPGANTLRLLTSNSSDTGNAQIVFRDTYIGI